MAEGDSTGKWETFWQRLAIAVIGLLLGVITLAWNRASAKLDSVADAMSSSALSLQKIVLRQDMLEKINEDRERREAQRDQREIRRDERIDRFELELRKIKGRG